MSEDLNRRYFDAEFKREAVRLSYEPGNTMASVARDLGISETNIWRWRKKFSESDDNSSSFSSADAELRKLRRQLRDITEERDILKKALGVFSRRLK